jgi:hypothetical protein
VNDKTADIHYCFLPLELLNRWRERQRPNLYGTDRTGTDAGAATRTDVSVQHGRGPAPGLQSKADGGLFTTLAATAADHPIAGQTFGLDVDLQSPGRLVRIGGKGQGVMPAGPHTVPTEGAETGLEVYPGITRLAASDDPLWAVAAALVATGTEFDKARFRSRPWRADGKSFALQVTSEELSPVDRFRHLTPLAYRLAFFHPLTEGSLMWVKQPIGSNRNIPYFFQCIM